MLPKENPLSKYNDFFYMESGMGNMPIYIFKFGQRGFLVEMHLNEKGANGQRAKVYSLIFNDEYDFQIDKQLKQVIRSTFDSLYEGICEIIDGALKNGK